MLRWFRRVATVAVFGVVLVACGGSAEVANPSSGATVTTATNRHPDAIPDFVFELHDGSLFQLAAEERPVFVVFWAEWCPYCEAELPILDRLSAEYENVVFLAVGGLGTLDMTIERGNEWMPSGRMLWGIDPTRVIWSLFGARGTPTIALVSGDDRLVGAWAGEVGEEELRARIDYLIAADAGADIQTPDLTGGESSEAPPE